MTRSWNWLKEIKHIHMCANTRYWDGFALPNGLPAASDWLVVSEFRCVKHSWEGAAAVVISSQKSTHTPTGHSVGPVRWWLVVASLCSKNVPFYLTENMAFWLWFIASPRRKGQKRLRNNLVKSRILSVENQLLPYSCDTGLLEWELGGLKAKQSIALLWDFNPTAGRSQD